MTRRETIIALRARHQAFRVATDLDHPHLDPPPPPQPAIPMSSIPPRPEYAPMPPRGPLYVYVDDDDYDEYRPPDPSPSRLARILMHDVVLGLGIIAAGVVLILLCAYG
jgi:hypothetical protein